MVRVRAPGPDAPAGKLKQLVYINRRRLNQIAQHAISVILMVGAPARSAVDSAGMADLTDYTVQEVTDELKRRLDARKTAHKFGRTVDVIGLADGNVLLRSKSAFYGRSKL